MFLIKIVVVVIIFSIAKRYNRVRVIVFGAIRKPFSNSDAHNCLFAMQ